MREDGGREAEEDDQRQGEADAVQDVLRGYTLGRDKGAEALGMDRRGRPDADGTGGQGMVVEADSRGDARQNMDGDRIQTQGTGIEEATVDERGEHKEKNIRQGIHKKKEK